MTNRPILVVAGVGTGSGTGAASARVFAQVGYNVALVARDEESLKKTAEEIKQAGGGDAEAFPAASYDYPTFATIFADIKKKWPSSPVRAAVYNAAYGVWKPFLDVTEQEVKEAVDTNITAAFAFSREVILAFKSNDLNEDGKRGTLIFTGATASIRGNTTTSSFAAGKHGLRALSQSLAKEFGKENIHVAHAIIDGVIITGRTKERKNDPSWENNPDVRLDPESIAKTYLALAKQDRSALTWELDLRPAHEKW
ncbi:NAD(P)-binding protein [Punctularia strigosozonata HHB-11173 SS5]|uniref:NAD(P)-binding protein n=1 Tax=Punctularia strigosozonata (strain HHB-11173) TaxID=741275 RepID=UPI00044165F0|nr:NAD(P)-binding protein [Punctularia strigosozonata HHB-11173 SS5]EIN05329.1 NAD(P)-binding protein [Punctularia strigosozonata HHB-11173 SS5]